MNAADDDEELPEGWEEVSDWLQRHNEDVSRLTPERRRELLDDLLGQIEALGLPTSRGRRVPTEDARAVAHRSSSRPRQAAAAVLVAAAITAVALILAVTGPTHPDPEVAADTTPSTTAPAAPTSLAALAERAAARQGPVLGATESMYAHRVMVREGPPPAAGQPAAAPFRTEIWIDVDGNGRRVNENPGNPLVEREDTPVTDGSLLLADVFPPAAALALPTEVEPLLAEVRTVAGFPPDHVGFGDVVTDLLAVAGLPSAVRGALIEALDALGFAPLREADELGQGFEGPGIDGGTYVVVFGEDTVPLVLRTIAADGSTLSTVSYAEVELRPDLSDG